MEKLNLRNKLIASKKDKLFLKRSSEKLVNPKNYGNSLNLGIYLMYMLAKTVF